LGWTNLGLAAGLGPLGVVDGGSTSSNDAIAPGLEFLEPLGRSSIAVSHGSGGGHEEHARQQGQDKDDPLGVHGKCRGVEVVSK